MQQKNPDIIKTIGRELLQLFKASQLGFVYTLNVALVFFGFGTLISLVLINSGDFFINILNFLAKKFSISDGNYHESYSLKSFFWYSYLFVTLIIYLIQKWWHRRFGTKLIVQTKYKMIAIPVVICSGYALVIYFFSQNYGFLSTPTLIFSILAIVTIIANYYYLLVSYVVKYLETKLA
jgi:hypothetical protein